jgi:hypothetical protein
VEIGSIKFWNTYVTSPKLPKENNRANGENSPNPVTLAKNKIVDCFRKAKTK